MWVSLILHRISGTSIPTAISSAHDFLGERPDSLSEVSPLPVPCHALGTLRVLRGWRRKGAQTPTPCFAFGKASCNGAVIPAVNKPFPGLLMGTIWQRGASRPPSHAPFLLPCAGNPPALGEPLGQCWAGACWERAGSALREPWWPLWRGEGSKAPCTRPGCGKRDPSEAGWDRGIALRGHPRCSLSFHLPQGQAGQ